MNHSVWNKKKQGMEDTHHDDIDHKNTCVVAKLVSKEPNNRRSYENTEWKDGVNEGDIHVIDADIFHVNGEVWKNGVCRGRKHEEGTF